MKTQRDSRYIEHLAYQIWEEQGRPNGRRKDHWAEAERRLNAEAEITSTSVSQTDGQGDDAGATGRAQDTPGRPKSASSRQQTQPDQSTQTGSADLDGSGEG
jgi:hypothetical protein